MPAGIARAAATARAIKASGAVVQVEPEAFLALVRKSEAPLVVVAQGRLIRSNHYYLTAYKGLIFTTRSEEALPLGADVEVIAAKDIWVPD
jgi:hypothetical protein